MEQEKELQFGELLRRIGISVKKNWLILAVVMVLFTVAGIGYAYYRKSVYTARQNAVYSAKLDPSSTSLNDYTITLNMIDTFVDFCDEAVVLDRANFYYDGYKKSATELEGLDAYVESIRETDTYGGSYDGEEYITPSDVSVTASSYTDSNVSFNIVVKCNDKDAEAARVKVKLLVLAIDSEAHVPAASDGLGEYKYFGAYVSLEDYGYIGSTVDMSKTKIVIIAFILGVVAGLLAVYVVCLVNRTVREKSELEAITGTAVLAFISNSAGGAKNGRK